MTNQLVLHYAEAAEWNLATLDELISIKSSSKSRIDRQQGICLKMLRVCLVFRDQILRDGTGVDARCGRVRDILKAAQNRGNLDAALSEWVEKVVSIWRK